jgi:hypothetical protein
MHCTFVNVEGKNVIICGRKVKPTPQCAFCGEPSTKVCDFPVRDSAGNHIKWYARDRHTCDKPICERCATSIGVDRDLCPEHARQWGLQAKAKAAGK